MRTRIVAICGVLAGLGIVASLALLPRTGPGGTLSVYPEPEQWSGVSWSDATPMAAGSPAWAELNAAIRTGNELLVWGVRLPAPSAIDSEEAVPTLWSTSDGETWTGRTVALGAERFTPFSVTQGPLGLLATGYSQHAKYQILAGSADGMGWAELPRPTEEGEVFVVAGADDGYVAMGLVRDQPVVWKTTDAVDWAALPLPAGLQGLQVNDIAVSEVGIHLAATVSGPGTFDAPGLMQAVLLRFDGTSWIPGELPMSATRTDDWMSGVFELIPFRGGLLALGRAGPAPECMNDGKTASTADTPPPRTADTTGECPWPPNVAWVTSDGSTWRAAALPEAGPSDAEVPSPMIDSGAAGLVALAFDGRLGNSRQFRLWTSADGLSWERIGDSVVLGPGSWPSRLLALSGRVVMLGNDESGAAWASLGTAAP